MKGSIIILAGVLMILVGSWDGYKPRNETVGAFIPGVGGLIVAFGMAVTPIGKKD